MTKSALLGLVGITLLLFGFFTMGAIGAGWYLSTHHQEQEIPPTTPTTAPPELHYRAETLRINRQLQQEIFDLWTEANNTQKELTACIKIEGNTITRIEKQKVIENDLHSVTAEPCGLGSPTKHYNGTIHTHIVPNGCFLSVTDIYHAGYYHQDFEGIICDNETILFFTFDDRFQKAYRLEVTG